MIEKTSSDIVPWTLVEAEDKRYARIKVLRTVCLGLEKACGGDDEEARDKRKKRKKRKK